MHETVFGIPQYKLLHRHGSNLRMRTAEFGHPKRGSDQEGRTDPPGENRFPLRSGPGQREGLEHGPNPGEGVQQDQKLETCRKEGGHPVPGPDPGLCETDGRRVGAGVEFPPTPLRPRGIRVDHRDSLGIPAGDLSEGIHGNRKFRRS